MVAFLIVSTIAGAILGLRFKVFVLGPATLLVMVAITVIGIANGNQASAIVFTVFGTSASFQIGYFTGCILRAAILPSLLSGVIKNGSERRTHAKVGSHRHD